MRRMLALVGIVVVGSAALAVASRDSPPSPRHSDQAASARAARPSASATAAVAASSPPGSPETTPSPRVRYVDCAAGNDRSAGTREAPLRTVTAATAAPLRPGDAVLLARGCTWAGPIAVRGNGTAAAPIVLDAYGTGPAPVLQAATSDTARSGLLMAGDYQVARNLRVTGAAGAGITIEGRRGAVSDAEVDHVGIGVLIRGAGARVSRVKAHDLQMVVNTVGGDDDYGATGFIVQADDAQIGWSSCTRCRAPSHDYGHDGGFADIWNHGDDLVIHHATGEETDGVLEIGGDSRTASARRITLRDNDFRAAHGGVVVHVGNRFAIPVTDLVITRTTITNTLASDPPVLSGDVRNLRFEGNTVATPAVVSASGAPARHSCNRYAVSAAANVGFSLDATERAGPTVPAALTTCG
ncbi:hypothetical protein [Dactylosporangium sp. NPDC051541]|uniref:hypothetical protein n=1 Tax=Dactylosporangium sp. NPDC051541 TaxID=3363977 RepID=UPI0037AA4CDD